MQEELATARA